MEIIRKNFDGIEYYLIDIYDDEFSFGRVYHFEADIGDKYCFYKDNTYISIENKKYLKKIKEKLEINTNIIYKKLDMSKIGNRVGMLLSGDIFIKIERLTSEEEYKIYDNVSKIINELYPDISYEDTMKALNDDSGIYIFNLAEGTLGNYNNVTNRISLDKKENLEELEDTKLHEAIHKLTNRNGFIRDNKNFIGLVEGGTAKICENKYGDKTSHIANIGKSKVHLNFSDSTYPLQQAIYRQMTQLVNPQMADEALINGSFDIFLNKFGEMYGKDLLLYLNHRATMITKYQYKGKNSNEKKIMKYFEEAQEMLLSKVFNQKMSTVETEEDMINYMTELKNFEYCMPRHDDYFSIFYKNKYNDIIDLAKQKRIDLSKIEEFEYSPIEFYPVRDCKKNPLSKNTEEHLRSLSNFFDEKLDLKKYTRIQIEDLPNFYNLDVVLQDGIPISSSSYVAKEDKESPIYEDLGVDRKNADIYDIGNNNIAEAFMIINSDGTSEVWSRSYETYKIYKGTINQIDLRITLEDIEKYKEEHSFALLNKIKNFFSNLVHRKGTILTLPNATVDKYTNNYSETRNSFLSKLNPDNEIYDQSTIGTIEKQSKVNKESIKDETENDI